MLAALRRRELTGRSYSLDGVSGQLIQKIKGSRLREIVRSPKDLKRNIYLGFIRSSCYLLSYSWKKQIDYAGPDDPLYLMRTVMDGSYHLNIWLFQPDTYLKLVRRQRIFSLMEKTSHMPRLFLYQWRDDPGFMFVTGEFRLHEQLSVALTYLPVPRAACSTCDRCPKAADVRRDGVDCCAHDLVVDFIFRLESGPDSLNRRAQFRNPGCVYINLFGDTLSFLHIKHERLADVQSTLRNRGEPGTLKPIYVFPGERILDRSSAVVGSDTDGLTVVCSDAFYRFYLPRSQESLLQATTGLTEELLVVYKSRLDLDRFVPDVLDQLPAEVDWMTEEAFLLDYHCDYLDVCERSLTAICLLSLKLRLSVNRHVIHRVLFTWDVVTGITTLFHRFDPESVKKDTTISPILTASDKMFYKVAAPMNENPHVLSNIAVLLGDSLRMLTSCDGASKITL